VSDYPQLTIRLPAATKAKLSTLSLLTANPIWRIIERAVDVYVQNLPEPERSRLVASEEIAAAKDGHQGAGRNAALRRVWRVGQPVTLPRQIFSRYE
jgi:hypothetical protein